MNAYIIRYSNGSMQSFYGTYEEAVKTADKKTAGTDITYVVV